MSEKHDFGWVPRFIREHSAGTPSGPAETSVNPSLAKAGELCFYASDEQFSHIARWWNEFFFLASKAERREEFLKLVNYLGDIFFRQRAYAAGRAASGVQSCPVCLGRTKVPTGFYGGIGSIWASATSAPETCRSCAGKGYLAAAPAPAQLTEEQCDDAWWRDVDRYGLLEQHRSAWTTGFDTANALLRSQPAKEGT